MWVVDGVESVAKQSACNSTSIGWCDNGKERGLGRPTVLGLQAETQD